MKVQILLIILAIFFLLVCCRTEHGEEVRELQEVKTITVRKMPEKIKLQTYGTITYNKKNDVTALVEGTIIEKNIQEGDFVRKNEVLLRMKNVQYEIQKTECENAVNSAKAKLKAAENNLRNEILSVKTRLLSVENSKASLSQKEKTLRFSKENLLKQTVLFNAGAVSENAMEKLKLDVAQEETEIAMMKKEIQIQELGFREEDLNEAGMFPAGGSAEKERQIIDFNTRSARINIELANTELKNANENLKSVTSLMNNLVIRAPCDGIIGILNYECGEYVGQNDKIMTIIDMKIPYALVNVQEKDISSISQKARTEINISSLGIKQSGTIDYISPLADSDTGNFIIKIPIFNDGNRIKLGMFCHVEIESNDTEKVFLLPEEAVIRREENNISFYCVKNGYVVKRECVIQKEHDGKVFIGRGLNDGEIIVVNPSPLIKEGSHVKCI